MKGQGMEEENKSVERALETFTPSFPYRGVYDWVAVRPLRRCHEIDYPPELAYPRGYSISIPIYLPPRKITTDR